MSIVTRRTLLALLLAAGLAGSLGTAGPAAAAATATSRSTSEIAHKAVDVFPIRFGGFLRTVVGSVLLVPATVFSTFSLPFDRNPDVFRENYELLVLEPFDYTFRRPLGQDF